MIDLKNAYEIRNILNNKVIDTIKDELGRIVYEAFKKLSLSGILPLTLNKCKGVDLVDYKLYGNSIQEGENLFSKEKMTNGFLPQTGDYPTTNASYPYASYMIIDIKEGETLKVTYEGNYASNWRIRCIDNDTNKVVSNVVATNNNDYFSSTISGNQGIASGTITAKKDFKIGLLYILSIPDSGFNLSIVSTTPMPNAPIEVESVGEKTRNLIRYPYIDKSKEQDGLKFTVNGDGSVTINGTASKNTLFNLTNSSADIWEGVVPNETYTLSMTGEGKMTGNVSVVANYYPSSSSNYSSWLNATLNKTKTDVAPENMVNIRAYIYAYSGATFNNFTVYPQLVKGDTVGEWEPYNKHKIPVKVSNDTEEIITNIYLDEPLRKVGDYEDYIDFENQKVVRKIYKVEIDGTWSWSDYSTSNLAINLNNFAYRGIGTDSIKSNCGNAGASKYRFSNSNYNRIQIHYAWFGVENLDGLKAKLIEMKTNGKPFTIYYPTNQRPEETIELPNIPTFKGTTILSVDTTIQPSNAEVKYMGKK